MERPVDTGQDRWTQSCNFAAGRPGCVLRLFLLNLFCFCSRGSLRDILSERCQPLCNWRSQFFFRKIFPVFFSKFFFFRWGGQTGRSQISHTFQTNFRTHIFLRIFLVSFLPSPEGTNQRAKQKKKRNGRNCTSGAACCCWRAQLAVAELLRFAHRRRAPSLPPDHLAHLPLSHHLEHHCTLRVLLQTFA